MPVLQGGAAQVDVTPLDSQFLYGYPNVSRYSTGVHDPLLASALCLNDGRVSVVFISTDIIFITKTLAESARRRIAELTGVPAENIVISATHTHSGPVTVRYLSNEADSVVPEPDPVYLQRLEDGVVEAGRLACSKMRPIEVGLARADGSCVGTNRRRPGDPSDPQVPVLLAREADGGPFIAAMLVCSMHPTVLHEDSTLVSGDFPGMCRRYLQEHVLGRNCPVLHQTGAAGNQSPRHVTRGNTFDEARRLGELLGRSIEQAIGNVLFERDLNLDCRQALIESIPLRRFPRPPEAAADLERARKQLDRLRRENGPRADIRTAECDVFGAEETLTLAKAAESGRLEAVTRTCLPAEVQLVRIGRWSFLTWPGEVFVEFALSVKDRFPDTFVITLANGELQGYQVTAEAAAQGGYEASNALFRAPDGGNLLVETSLRLMTECEPANERQ